MIFPCEDALRPAQIKFPIQCTNVRRTYKLIFPQLARELPYQRWKETIDRARGNRSPVEPIHGRAFRAQLADDLPVRNQLGPLAPPLAELQRMFPVIKDWLQKRIYQGNPERSKGPWK